ncbi:MULTISPECIES: UDP-N-acetylglucosamine 1-carboxyvinyltransferase [Prochlorococcus]|uniref:UDP-N-acetylglucosamine 1-carboxyvinyltransferase n=1 Tax=Prochlorococcus TaxID=1218 RepID=UPI0005339C2F|nr:MULTISPECIES: UDP-N-acetylglucosamine 1-carboxyvinyltransferase [Prochlorococcus]KGG11984.1 UDP-N-acetylglucosamine 1-carboxyvinyltransferase [Prochlorococcus sp. MIT 0601]
MPRIAASQRSLYTECLEVSGTNFLSGEIHINGAKNSALALMAASLLTDDTIFLENVPDLTDIKVMSKLLNYIGISTQQNSHTFQLNAKQIANKELPSSLVNALRASFFCIGPLLARLGEVRIPLPGGCKIGHRPIDEHIRGLKALGAFVSINDGTVIAKLPPSEKTLKGTCIKFNCQSVGATETTLMAATLAEGRTILENAAQEPEIQDLAKMLNSMGAKVKGAGTKTIIIDGVTKLNGCHHKVIPDRIEAGTFLIAAAITRSTLTIKPVTPEHLEAVIQKLRDCGCEIEVNNDNLTIIPKLITAVDITTEPYPGFPTDLQAPFMALMATAKGNSIIKETIFERRMQHVGELQKMGALIDLQGNTAFIKGVSKLVGKSISAGDLRSSAALVLASLSAKGKSNIQGVNYLDRGYEKMENKLNNVGANIIRAHRKIDSFASKSYKNKSHFLNESFSEKEKEVA